MGLVMPIRAFRWAMLTRTGRAQRMTDGTSDTSSTRGAVSIRPSDRVTTTGPVAAGLVGHRRALQPSYLAVSTKPNPSDGELLTACRAGDHDAFGVFYA